MTTLQLKLHILNWGMGVESTAILLRWIFEPWTRPFECWSQLIVLVAQTGDEFWETKYLCETFIFPLLRKLGVRVVQVAKHGPFKDDGYTILSDTTEPYELHIEGDHALSDNMLMDGWVPRVGRPHICAMRWKGEVLDAWIRDHIIEAFGPYLGYNRDELGRMKDAQDYGCRGRAYIFPLIEWDWSRDDCLDYIFRMLGVIWHKSCCKFCPFQTRANAIAHYKADPQAAVFALWCEFVAMAMNPRMRLFERFGMQDICLEAGLDESLSAFAAKQREAEWAVYRVRRIYRHVGNPSKPRVDASRSVETIATGSQAEMTAVLTGIANKKELPLTFDGHQRCYSHVRDETHKVYPAIEGFWVVSPATTKDKCYRKNFDLAWRQLTLEQLEHLQVSLH